MKARAALSVFALVAVSALTACGGGGGDSAGASSDSTSSPTDPASSPTESATTPDDNGGGASGSYCDALKQAQSDFKDLSSGDIAASLDQLVDRIKGIAAKAPSSVADDYQVLTGAFDDLRSGLAGIGIKLSDLTNRQVLQKLPPDKIAKLQSILTGFNTGALTKASNAITAEASKDCGIKLGN